MPMPIPPAEATPGLRSEAFKTPKPVDPPDEVDGRFVSSTLPKLCVRLVLVVSRATPASAATSTVVFEPTERVTLVVEVLLSSTVIA